MSSVGLPCPEWGGPEALGWGAPFGFLVGSGREKPVRLVQLEKWTFACWRQKPRPLPGTGPGRQSQEGHQKFLLLIQLSPSCAC